METNAPFPHSYGVEICESLPVGPGAPDVFYFPGASARGGADGVIVRVAPSSQDAFVGVFAFGTWGNEGVDWVGSAPEPHTLCVVARGALYLIDVRHRSEIPSRAACVSRVLPDIAGRVLVFADVTRLTAVGPEGPLWTSVELSDDTLELLKLENGLAVTRVWNAAEQEWRTAYIDLKNGVVVP